MIELKNITKVFNQTGNEADKKIALNDLNLTINDEEFVTIIGSNGSGKSTTFNIISGAIQPDDGRILLSGIDITKMKEHQRAKFFGRVFQDPMMGTTSEMSCLENLEIAFRRGKTHSAIKWGFSKTTIRDYFVSLLKEFNLGLENRLNEKVGVLSGGQRQALTLIMAACDSRLDTKNEFIKMHVDTQAGPFIESIITQNHLKRTEIVKISDLLKKNNFKEKLKIWINESKAFYIENFKIYKENNNKIKNSNQTNDEKREEYLKNYLWFSNTLHDFNKDKKILLLDEHTAALDPKTAKSVLELTNKIVRTKKLTTIMITHNMKDAITYGDRLIMFYNGHIIHDFNKMEKENLTVDKLLDLFEQASKEKEI